MDWKDRDAAQDFDMAGIEGLTVGQLATKTTSFDAGCLSKLDRRIPRSAKRIFSDEPRISKGSIVPPT